MSERKEKRRSYIRTSGSAIVPISGTVHLEGGIGHQLTSPTMRSVLDPIESLHTVEHDLAFSTHVKTSSMIKLLLIGNASVGKSSLIVSYCDDVFLENSTKTTVGVDLKAKVVKVDGKFFKTVIWDTAGQERYRNVIPSLYKGTNGVILTYDVTDMKSFLGLYHWIEESYENCDVSRTIFYLVGNKIDQGNKVVSNEDVKALVEHVSRQYAGFKINAAFETSAKYSDLVYGLFDTVIKDLVENRCYFDEQRLRNKRSIDLSTTSEHNRASSCCSY